MSRDPLLPVRLVGGVWTTEGAGPDAAEPGITALGRGAEWPCSVTLPPRPATDYARAFAEYNPPPLVVTMDADEARRVAEHVLVHGQRTIFAAVSVADTSGVWAIGDTEQEARAGALDRREHLRDEARTLDLDFPPSDTDAAWSAALAIVTLSGTTESLRALIKSMETGDPVAPWCPADLWDNLEPVKEP